MVICNGAGAACLLYKFEPCVMDFKLKSRHFSTLFYVESGRKYHKINDVKLYKNQPKLEKLINKLKLCYVIMKEVKALRK